MRIAIANDVLMAAEVLRRVIVRAGGHEVAHHTHTHPLKMFWCASPAQVARELDPALEDHGPDHRAACHFPGTPIAGTPATGSQPAGA